MRARKTAAQRRQDARQRQLDVELDDLVDAGVLGLDERLGIKAAAAAALAGGDVVDPPQAAAAPAPAARALAAGHRRRRS